MAAPTTERLGLSRMPSKISCIRDNTVLLHLQTADYTGVVYKANLNFADDESKKRNYKNIFVPTKCLKVTNVPTGKTGNEVAAFFRERGLGVGSK